MDVSESILAKLDAGYPCRHDEVWFSCPLGECKVEGPFHRSYEPIQELVPGELL